MTKILQEATLSAEANGEEELIQDVILHFSKKLHFILYVLWGPCLSRHSLGFLMSKSINEYLLHLVTQTMLPVNSSYVLCDLLQNRDEHPKSAQSTLEVLSPNTYKEVPTHI